GQAAQQDAVGDELQQATVEAHGHSAAGEVVADGALPAGEGDRADGVDHPVYLDRAAGLAGDDRRWPGRTLRVGGRPIAWRRSMVDRVVIQVDTSQPLL